MNFILTELLTLSPGDVIVSRRDADNEIVGFDRVTISGSRTPVPGHMTAEAPCDTRTRLPLSIEGVHLWWGVAL